MEPDYELIDLVKQQGYRTVLAVPMLREGALRGIITILKTNVEPFTDKQIELVETFADQAVIAIENVLFDDVQARSREVKESLEYQTAITDVLNVISRSPNALQPVLDTIVQTAARLCEAEFSVLFRLHEGNCHIGATNADNATNAATAASATTLAGRPPSAFMASSQVIHSGLVTTDAGNTVTIASFPPFTLTLVCSFSGTIDTEIDVSSTDANSLAAQTPLGSPGVPARIAGDSAPVSTLRDNDSNVFEFLSPNGKSYQGLLAFGENFAGHDCFANALIGQS